MSLININPRNCKRKKSSGRCAEPPDSIRGILSRWEREAAKFLCTTCGTLQTPVDVKGKILQVESAAIYEDCVLSCGHSRNISVKASRGPAAIAKLNPKRTEANEVEEMSRRERAVEIKHAERTSLRSEMESAGVPMQPLNGDEFLRQIAALSYDEIEAL